MLSIFLFTLDIYSIQNKGYNIVSHFYSYCGKWKIINSSVIRGRTFPFFFPKWLSFKISLKFSTKKKWFCTRAEKARVKERSCVINMLAKVLSAGKRKYSRLCRRNNDWYKCGFRGSDILVGGFICYSFPCPNSFSLVAKTVLSPEIIGWRWLNHEHLLKEFDWLKTY